MEEQKFQERRKVKDNNQQSENTLACARGMTYAYGDTCVSSKCLSDHARVRARAIPANFVAAWRKRIFADGGQRGRRRKRPSSDRSRLRYGAIVVIPGGAATTPLRVAARDPLG